MASAMMIKGAAGLTARRITINVTMLISVLMMVNAEFVI